MPNYVINKITFRNLSEQEIFERFTSADENGKRYFDFNRIIPMPETLDICSGGVQDIAKQTYYGKFDPSYTPRIRPEDFIGSDPFVAYANIMSHLTSVARDIVNDAYSEGRSFSKNEAEYILYELGGIYVSNAENYGYETWYDWRINNWGTKWNAGDCSISDNTVIFTTAWSAPENIYRKLSESGCDFSAEYADENIGFNTGIYESDDGTLTQTEFGAGNKEAYEHAAELWEIDLSEDYFFDGTTYRCK